MNGPLFLAEEWHCSQLLTLRIIVNYGGHFGFFVAMTTEENVEHMIVLLLYEIHVILTVHISTFLMITCYKWTFSVAILIYSLPWQPNKKNPRNLCPVYILVQEYIGCSYLKNEYFLVKNAIEVIWVVVLEMARECSLQWSHCSRAVDLKWLNMLLI